MTIDSDLHTLATSKNFAALSTLAADGQPRTHVMWIDADDEHVVFNTDIGRAKYRDVKRDERVTVAVIDQTNPYRYVEARGRVVATIEGDAAADHINALSQRYLGTDYAGDTTTRVIVKILPDAIHKNGFAPH